ncbi:MAG: hypothetical protein ACR2N3_18450 [Pyrinomonadaceae bacterium]
MATQEETNQAVVKCLNHIGQWSKIDFEEYDVETQTRGDYDDDNWTYKIVRQRVSLEYWFSSFSSRKEETDITYGADGDRAKLESDLRACLDKLREIVKRKKSMF